ncbi:helix-turn-helix domain-containing protein [Halobacillus sp. BBL2006]|uniref:helix-turn-helix domain-containing protein n=1 Tax=Halobacillus sp. BBL2006 TaxID=1543706 RepID=UPI000543C8DA|nr:helix-turn-helix domain-containing protein [Halobacillus sp. BBL2006]KHE69925.1 hypothetical protein LD39_12215 [Halobacillus sp. BBL2006]
MFDLILLNCVQRLKGERTISGVFNLLTGKRSSQTLQDARVYHLDSYFGIYNSLDRVELDRSFQRLEEGEWITIEEKSYPSLTEIGEEYVKKLNSPLYFSGLMDHQKVAEFERRLLLLIQTLTNMIQNKRTFIPIIEDVNTQIWVKKVYSKYHSDITRVVSSLYSEISTLLDERPAIEAKIFAYRLTGGGIIGLTRDQLQDKYDISVTDVDVYIQHVIYYLFHHAVQSPDRYPFLSLCSKGLDGSSLITESAKKTYHYIENGWSIDDIVRKRRLKKSTIQDHIVEAALVVPHFSIDSFLNEKELNKIIYTAKELDTQRLKLIHQKLDGQFSYFQLRLALAKDQISSKEGNSYANV